MTADNGMEAVPIIIIIGFVPCVINSLHMLHLSLLQLKSYFIAQIIWYLI